MHDNTFSYFDLFFTKMLSGWLVHTRKEIFTSKGIVYMNLNNGDYEMGLDDVCLT